MFTVIIPTMWRSEYTPKLLNDLNNCPEVGEIILIENTPEGENKVVGKTRYISQGRNIYVNPAWNWGVREAKYENICICNDDVNFSTSVFRSPYIRVQGVVGMASDNYYVESDLSLETFDKRPWGWGCLIFTKKSLYKPIPEDLLIACGDDYLIQELPAFALRGLKVDTRISTTSFNPEFFPIQDNDLKLFNEKYRR